jgi:hypothetical protein
MSLPSNMTVESEPDYRIVMRSDGMFAGWLKINGRCTWKRLTAISHARYYARHHPNLTWHVEIIVAPQR